MFSSAVFSSVVRCGAVRCGAVRVAQSHFAGSLTSFFIRKERRHQGKPNCRSSVHVVSQGDLPRFNWHCMGYWQAANAFLAPNRRRRRRFN